MKESVIEGFLTRTANMNGMLSFKFVSPQNNGVPDRILGYRGWSIYVETKTVKGIVSDIQKWQINRMRRKGMWVMIIDRTDRIPQMVMYFKGLIDQHEDGKIVGSISQQLRIMCEQFSDIKLIPVI